MTAQGKCALIPFVDISERRQGKRGLALHSLNRRNLRGDLIVAWNAFSGRWDVNPCLFLFRQSDRGWEVNPSAGSHCSTTSLPIYQSPFSLSPFTLFPHFINRINFKNALNSWTCVERSLTQPQRLDQLSMPLTPKSWTTTFLLVPKIIRIYYTQTECLNQLGYCSRSKAFPPVLLNAFS